MAVSLDMVLMSFMMGNSDDNMVPPLYNEALVHRPEACNAMLEMLTSGGGLAVHPSTFGFDNGDTYMTRDVCMKLQ